MKTTHTNKLLFVKRALTELSSSDLHDIRGGSESIDWPITGCLCTIITRTINQN